MKLNRIIEAGVKPDMDPLEARFIRYTNILSLMVMASNLVISAVLYNIYGPALITIIIFLIIFVFAGVIYLSSIGIYGFGRLMLSILIPVGIMIISIVTKSQNPELVTSYAYFDTRTVLLGILAVPIVIFPAKNKLYLLLGIILPGLFIIFYNPIHELFGVGYGQILGEKEVGYRMSGVYYSISYVFLVTGLLIFKFNNEELMHRNTALVNDLKSSNRKLREASDTIHEQSLALIQSNKELTELVDQQTRELKNSNEELIKHNLELQQFSNTISHNLRGPVANILGLSQLFDTDSDPKALQEVMNHIKSSAVSLDEVLKDLGKIIDIRNYLFQIKENVLFSEEFEKVKVMLEEQIKACDAQIELDFRHDQLYCIRSYIDSILYNLTSNAIKYRDVNRPLKIKVSTKLTGNKVVLEVADNGVGIDIDKHGDKLFGMYKRFHDHVEGKGLGLFLTKQQIEALGGKISVESEVGKGTKFIVTIPIPADKLISEQVYYESDVVTIWFDAIHNISTLVWKRKPSSEEYREGLLKNLEIFRTYTCNGCLADVRKLGYIEEEDRKWFIENILYEAVDNGMRKFIVVRDKNDGKDDRYYEAMRKMAEKSNIYFNHTSFDMEEAKYIVRNKITGN